MKYNKRIKLQYGNSNENRCFAIKSYIPSQRSNSLFSSHRCSWRQQGLPKCWYPTLTLRYITPRLGPSLPW